MFIRAHSLQGTRTGLRFWRGPAVRLETRPGLWNWVRRGWSSLQGL